MGSPPRVAPNASGVGKSCVFRPVEKSPARRLTAKNLFPSATVVRVHDGIYTLAEEYAMSSTTLAVTKICLYDKEYLACAEPLRRAGLSAAADTLVRHSIGCVLPNYASHHSHCKFLLYL